MTILAPPAMAARLTEPFAPGADMLWLSLTPTANPAVGLVSAYDFAEHEARFEHRAIPFYVLVAQQDVVADVAVSVDYGPAPGGSVAPGSVTIAVPAGALAGASFALSGGHLGPGGTSGAGVPPGTGVRLLQVRSAPPSASVPDAWRLLVLLGMTARVLWVIGVERDQIRRQLQRVVAQRLLGTASGRSLDYHGSDLGVPRFPPLPYPFDPSTIALYHLDDQPAAGQPEVDQVEDIISRYTPPGNPGTNVGRHAQSRIPGRFGAAFAFRDPNAEIRITSLSGMPVGAADSFTVECFVKPDAGAADGHVLAKHADPANAALAGWALSVGAFGRGIPANPRFLVSDGAHPKILFADQSVSADRFHHLAGVVDRAAGQAWLYLDGVVVASAPIADLGAVTNAEPVQIGRAGSAAFAGLIDEARLSSVARAAFHPVLGEDDDSYRKRLVIFRRWTLPTRANLQELLNEVVGSIAGPSGPVAQPIVVDDTDSTLVVGALPIAVRPVELKSGESISAAGDRRAAEADVCGTAEAETTFDPIFLLSNHDPRLTFASAPARVLNRGEAPPDPRKMQVVLQRRLAAFLDQLGATSGLRVESGFDPRALDLRAVGRAVLLTHETLTLGQLAARANRAGFDFVQYRSDLNQVYASCAPGDYLEILVGSGGTATPANGFDVFPGQTLVLGIQPTLPADASYRWITIAAGAGRGGFLVTTNGVTSLQPTATGASVTLQATTPGSLVVKVEAARYQKTASGTATYAVGLSALADGQTIADDGRTGVDESIASPPEPGDFFGASYRFASYLITYDAAGIDFGTDPNRRRMQSSVAARLDRLRTFLPGTPGNLQVLSAYTPGTADISGVGRGLTLGHTTLTPDQLGALAHAAGFTFVRRQGNQILIRQAPSDLVTVSGNATIDEGGSSALTVSPRSRPHGIAIGASAAYVVSSGTDTLSEVDPPTGAVRRAFKVGWNPVAVALSPDGARAYTADQRGNTVTPIDRAGGNVLPSIPVPAGPVALAHHPTQARLYVACRDANEVAVIDTNAGTVVGTVKVGTPPPAGAPPVGLAVRPDGAEVWVALDTSPQLAVLTTAPFAPSATIALPGPPAAVAFLPDGSRAYATVPSTGQVVVIAVATRTIQAQPHPGAAPTAIAVAPDGSAVFVGDEQGGTQASPVLLVLDPDGTAKLNPTGTAKLAVHVQAGPLTVAADSARVYVANQGADTVSVVDVAEGGLANTWSLGTGLGERLSWTTRLDATAKASLDRTTGPAVTLSATRAGQALVRAVYLNDDHNAPYTFAVRLTPTLEADPSVVIRKDQYDGLMNVLNAFHPIGVEVITRQIRERVIEVREASLNAFPDYTYPNFRSRAPKLRRPS